MDNRQTARVIGKSIRRCVCTTSTQNERTAPSKKAYTVKPKLHVKVDEADFLQSHVRAKY